MKKGAVMLLTACLFSVLLYGCGKPQLELTDMKSVIIDDKRAVVWEDRTYVPFCVVSKSDRGEQIGYVDGDEDDRISEYKDYSTDEWLVSWLPMDGGAMLMKEQSLTHIPEGLKAEY